MQEKWTKGNEICSRTNCNSTENIYMYNTVTGEWTCPDCAKLIDTPGIIYPVFEQDPTKKYYEEQFKHDLTWNQFKQLQEVFFF